MIGDFISKIPGRYRDDIRRAAEILKAAGCKDIFLFGSLANGNAKENSDIDIAVSGCPNGEYFSLLGKLLMEIHHPIDLIDLDKRDEFSQYLLEEGGLIHVL